MTVSQIIWTSHAELRLHQRGLTRELVEATLRNRHPNREINEGQADWRIDTGRFVVVYDHPSGMGLDAARIVSVWLKRQKHRRL
jgi:hypothetical protein